MSRALHHGHRSPARAATRRLLVLAAVPALALGCYASAELEEADPGARLRARVYRPASGPPAFAGWQDTELDVACGFVTAEDGRERCLPVEGATLMFEDAACRRPIARRRGCESTAVVRELVSPSPRCEDGRRDAYYRAWELGAPRSVDRLFTLRDGECVEASEPAGDAWEARRVPADTFVAAELAPSDASAGRVVPLELRAEDGSRELSRLFDRERGAECRAAHPREPTAPPVPCLPVGTVGVTTGGPGCDLDVAPADRCGDAPPLAERRGPLECGRVRSRTLYEVEATPVAAGEACDTLSAEGYLVREAAADAVPWLTPTTVGAAGDRLRRFAWEAAGGDTWPAPLYWDTELETACSPDSAPDGSLRCVPYDWVLSARGIPSAEAGPFADPGCRELAIVLTTAVCDAPRWVPLLGAAGACASAIESYRALGAPVDTIYRRDPATGTCAPDDLFPIHRAYRLGAVMPFERFAAGEIVVE